MVRALIFLVLVFLSFNVSAAQSMCTSNVTKEIEACARKNFEYADSVLNSAYADLASKLSAADRGVLVRAEREWLAYRVATCQDAYDATSPGEEGGVEKWTCFDQITRARADEIQLIGTGIGALGFYKEMDVVPKLYENGAREKFVSKLVGIYSESDADNWRSYVEDNCKLSSSRLHDNKSECVARQVFYRY
ncbi:hypothetical protein DP57_5996 [Burkholderia pseudomallei]|uniref:lysozyme inhibitor LprI family protein n=1 Tax=Burkholderia pseudomallei TaxID=28450 RepID=UPI00051019B1|nr:lysozyme inhibitor LprI family protein [Burkholderia pseudomallei]KGC70121.1 hypothetical protein DP57_5996 [Burkholderia pseudomallei]